MATPLELGPKPEIGDPEALFQTDYDDIGRYYEVSSDGQRFLMSSWIDDPSETPITVILDWVAELKK